MNQQPWQDSAAENDGERLFPRFVCRIGGAPVDGVERLRAPRTLAAAQALADADAELEAGRERVSAILHARIGQVEDDRAARQTLIRARRELFNLHPLTEPALDGVCALLPAGDAEALRAFQRALHGRAELARAADKAHTEESAQARAAFRGLVRDEDFRKGLLVSSRSLHAALDRYADSASAVPNAREEKTERGLLRYYTRMAMKATPFATFCAVVAGRFVPAEGDAGAAVDAPVLRLEGSPVPKRSFVRINKLLYGILLDHLKQRPGVRHALAVELNPTLRDEGPRRVFLTSLAGREVFQRLADNEVLHLITQAFRGRPTLGDLIRTLSSDPEIDATPEEAEAYLDKLIEIGFLRFHTGIREQDADWDGPLAELLEAIDDPHAQRSARLLREVRAQTDAYAAASVEQRGPIIAGILAALDEALVEMEVTGRLRRDMPFYEDATADARAEVALTPGVRRATDTFAEWARITSRLGWPRTEQASMRHFYDTFYAGRAGVPLLVFYEDFYREHFKAHVEKEQKSRAGQRDGLEGYDVGNPFGLEFIRTVNAARNRLQDAIVERWRAAPDAEEIRITMAEVQAALADVEPQPVPCRSVSAFALLAPPSEEGGDPAILLQGGSFTAGYGKYFSRFLYMLPDEFVAEVRESNEELTGELLAEICGDAQFNANLHPPLLRWEISYPTGESGAADEQLRSSDVFVEPDGDDPHSLCLRHGPTGRRVVPVDLGFLNPRMRPPLYQLLSRFTPPVTFAPPIPESTAARAAPPAAPQPDAAPADDTVDAPAAPDDTVALPRPAPGQDADDTVALPAPAPQPGADDTVDAAAAPASGDPPAEVPAPEIVHRPRVSVDGRVILSRRRWLVPAALFPQRQGDETAAAFFLRANRWRAEHGLPESHYLRVIPLPDPAAARPGAPTPADDAMDAALEVGVEAMPAAEEPQPEAAPAAAAEGAEGTEGEAKAPAKKMTVPSRDFYKPQFMDFGNPLLVAMLGRLGGGLKHYNIIVEERLPGRAALATADGEAYATEMIIQVDFPHPAGGTAALAAEEARGAAV